MTKISDFAGLLGADVVPAADSLPIIDDSETGSARNKKITVAELKASVAPGALAAKSTINNSDWSGTDLSIANGGTGASSAADARANLDVYSKAQVDAAVAGGGGGASALGDLTDVDTTGVADGDVLAYDSVAGGWVPEAPAGGAGGGGTDWFDKVVRQAVAAAVNTASPYLADHGLTMVRTGTGSSGTIGSSSYAASRARHTVSTGVSAGAFAALREANMTIYGLFGYKLRWRFRIETVNASDRRMFAGITSDTLLNTNEDPDQFDHVLGFGVGAADTNFHRLENDSGAGTATKTDTGIPFTVGDFYEVTLESEDGTSITMTLRHWTGTSPTPANTYTADVTADIPSDTQGLIPYIWATNNATANTVIFGVESLTLLY